MTNKNIVLIHGWGAESIKLGPLSNQLKELGWKAFAIKLPGFEKKAPPTSWNLNEYANYVQKESISRFKSQKYFVFGHSFGGRIAIKMALKYPNEISGLVLCCTGGISRANPLKRFVFWTLAKTGKALLIFPPGAKFWKKILYKSAREHDYEKTRGVMKEVFKKIIAEDLKMKVKKINLPTLILWGKEDKVTPFKDALFLKKNIANSKLVSFENQTHSLPYKLPKDLAKEINIWTRSL